MEGCGLVSDVHAAPLAWRQQPSPKRGGTVSLRCRHGSGVRYTLFSIGLLLVVLFTYHQASLNITEFSYSVQKKVNCPLERPQPRPKLVQAEAESDTLLLIWMWPFGFKFDLSCDKYDIKGCRLTDNKSLYHKAHGVFLHHRDIHSNLDNLPTEPRPWFQKWVWFNVESPTHSSLLPALNNLFNLTCTFRSDSHVSIPYGRLVQRTSEADSFQLAVKNKTVCWVVSNWNEKFARVQYYKELKKHIHIDGYGNGFGKKIEQQERIDLIRSCKFYLSFENSQHRDYITEKTYNPLQYGTVPIVLGPPRKIYEDHVPADAFIHVDDFSSPKELAEWLLYLDQNTTEYMKYLEWNKRFMVAMSEYPQEYACRSCSYLQKNKGYQSFNNLNSWYWGQSNLV